MLKLVILTQKWSKIISNHFGSNSLILTPSIQFAPQNDHFWLKIVILTPKMVEYIFEIISILTSAKNYTSNFSDTPFDPEYCTSSKASPTSLFNQPYLQCIIKIFQTFGWFFIICLPFNIKITRRTTGTKGFYFLTTFI